MVSWIYTAARHHQDNVARESQRLNLCHDCILDGKETVDPIGIRYMQIDIPAETGAMTPKARKKNVTKFEIGSRLKSNPPMQQFKKNNPRDNGLTSSLLEK